MKSSSSRIETANIGLLRVILLHVNDYVVNVTGWVTMAKSVNKSNTVQDKENILK